MEAIKLYIDPSVMSYTLQFVVAGVVTVGAIAGIVVRKAKKKIKKTLNIEEKKEVEDDIIYIYEQNKTEE